MYTVDKVLMEVDMEGKYRVLIYYPQETVVDSSHDCPLEAVARLNKLHNDGYNVRLSCVGERDEVGL